MIATKKNIIWDLFIRIFHWTLVTAFIISYLTEGEVYLHFYSGWYIVTLLVCRIIWGFIGSKHARFIDFIKPPTEIINYAKSLRNNNGTAKHYAGHNPLGGLMVVAMLCFLSLTCVTGILLYSEDGNSLFSFINYSPTASTEENHQAEKIVNAKQYTRLGSSVSNNDNDDDDDNFIEEKNEQDATTPNALSENKKYEEEEEDDDEEFLKEAHDLFANLTILLILFHIAGVVFSSRLHQENLVKAMFTGKKS